MNIQIQQIDNDLYIDSRIIAKGFEIEHNSLCKSLQKQFTDLKSIKSSDNQTGRPGLSYLITKRQVMIIPAICKTTEKTIQFQIALVDAFLAMEEQIKNQLPSDPKEQALLLATQLIESQKEIESLETTVKELTPKAEFHDQVTAREGWKPLSQFGKVSGIGFQRIFDFCEDLNLLYFSNGNRIPKTAVQKLGFLDLKEDNYKDKYGRVHTNYKVFVSGKGESLILQEWNRINRMSLFN